ncbi:MAG: hypothetical protein IT279_07500 [Ignavibacteriaceae bacterium]|nr:hypothetical protein [Ignavibacteriaceae bacterium]
MKLPLLFLLPMIFIASGCSGGDNSTPKQNTETTRDDTKNLKPRQEIKNNLSMIEGEVLGNYREDETDFVLKMRTSVVAKVDENENMAVLGEEIFMTPNFIIDEKGAIADDPVNTRLKQLSRIDKGATIRVHAFYVLKKGWYIKDYLIKN